MQFFKRKEKDTSPETIIKNHNRFFNWIQEYSKKIITITFILYVGINIYILVMVAIAYFQSNELAMLDTLITEINTTFRDVIGGYIIKAATENAFKITGSIIDRILEAKYGQYEESSEEEEEFIEEENMIEKDGLLWKAKK